MHFNTNDIQPHRTRTMDQTRRIFATGYDARWYGVRPLKRRVIGSENSPTIRLIESIDIIAAMNSQQKG